MKQLIIITASIALLAASTAEARGGGGRGGGGFRGGSSYRSSAPRVHSTPRPPKPQPVRQKPQKKVTPAPAQQTTQQTGGNWWMPMWLGYMMAPKGSHAQASSSTTVTKTAF